MLRTERDVVETLAGRTVTIDELYDAVEQAGVHTRAGGTGPIPTHGNDTVWRRRVRNALQTLKKAGKAERVARGTWVITGDRDEPTRALLVICPFELGPVELELADAAEFLDRLAGDGVEVDLVLTDPPWALGRQSGGRVDPNGSERIYARDHAKVVGGYREVDPGAWREFTHRWVEAAARLLVGRPGSQLAVVTGPQQAARVQVAAEDAGLTFVSQVVARRVFPVFNGSPRRFSAAHYVVTVCCAGPLTSKRRYFAVPADLPTARSGRPYPRTWWDDVGRADRPGLLRYDNSLPVPLVSRVIRSLTPGPEAGAADWAATVVDPMVGGGTTAVACWQTRRRFVGADLNPEALRFTIARLTDEHLPHPSGQLDLPFG